MAGVLQHLRSSTLDKRPNPASMVDGQVAINYASGSPGMFFKDSNGDLVKVGPVHVGTTAPNVSPASGGTAGNSKGEQWLDTTGGTYVFKVWDGSAWRSETGTFVDVNGDTMTGALGIIAGSASTPGLFFSGDTNTGIYSPGADQLALSTNGTGRLFVDSLGLVSIGDSGQLVIGKGESAIPTNSVKAHIFWGLDSIYGGTSGDLIMMPRSSAAANFRIYTGSTTPSERFRITGTGQLSYIGAGSAVSPAVSFNGSAPSNSFVITSAGLVGIGTSSASSTLDVFGPANGLQAEFNGSIDGRGLAISTALINGVNNGLVNFNARGAGTDGTFTFSTDGNERARIDSSGRLLVGTSTALGNDYWGAGKLQFSDNNGAVAQTFTYSSAGSAYTSAFELHRARGTQASPAVVLADDRLGEINFYGYNSSASTPFQRAATISAAVDGTPASGGDTTDMPGRLVFSTTADGASSPTERMRIDSSGRVGVGTTSPGYLIDGSNSSAPTLRLTDGIRHLLVRGGSTTQNPGIGTDYAGDLSFFTNGTANERARIDSSGRLLVGTSSSVSVASLESNQQIFGSAPQLSITRGSNNASGATLALAKSRNTAYGSRAIVADGDTLGSIRFCGDDGVDLDSIGAQIAAQVDGTPGSNDLPSRLVFSTTADGASSPTTRLTIESTGALKLENGASNIYRPGVSGSGIGFSTNSTIPLNETGATSDNTENLGAAGTRWATVYAGTGTINTSDATLKQDVADLEQAELQVASTIKGLIKKYRYIDAVANKGDDARIHVGVIAQEVEQAFVDEGLEPRRYALFCEDTLEDGSKRLGIRYDELLAFVIAAL